MKWFDKTKDIDADVSLLEKRIKRKRNMALTYGLLSSFFMVAYLIISLYLFKGVIELKDALNNTTFLLFLMITSSAFLNFFIILILLF